MSILGTRFTDKFQVTFNVNDPSNENQDNGTWQRLYVPARGIEYDHENLAKTSSGRTADGTMQLEFIQQDIVKVGLKWSYLTEDELKYLKDRLQGKKFQFKYYDCGEIKEMYAYCGKLKYALETLDYLGTGIAVYKDISANIIDRCGEGAK